MINEQLLRLSRFAVFVDYGDFIEVQHAARSERHRIDRATYQHLRRFTGFCHGEPSLQPWIEFGLLVEPFSDSLSAHDPAPNSEAALAADYQRWYWRHEVETERDYRWLGEVVVKMPSDLFYLQELLVSIGGQQVLELGRGRGGGVWFLAGILQQLGGGLVVSLDVNHREPEIQGSRWTTVEQRTLIGDALSLESLVQVRAITQHFDLIVIDLGGEPDRNLTALQTWAQLLVKRGTVVIEDLWGRDDERVISLLDQFLLENREFGLCELAARHPLLKGIGLRRTLSHLPV